MDAPFDEDWAVESTRYDDWYLDCPLQQAWIG